MTLAYSGWMSTRAEIDSLVFPTAFLSNHSPTWKNSITAIPSGYSPMIKAPAVAITIRKCSSKTCPWPMLRAALRITSYPTIRYPIRNTASCRYWSKSRMKCMTAPIAKIAAPAIMRISIFFICSLDPLYHHFTLDLLGDSGGLLHYPVHLPVGSLDGHLLCHERHIGLGHTGYLLYFAFYLRSAVRAAKAFQFENSLHVIPLLN